jgi:hypothetical protein
MTKRSQWLMTIVTLVTLSVSCKKDQLHLQSGSQNANLIKEHSDKVIVAKTLAKAVAENPQLRTFIKEEALKQFDKDDDILFQFVKDKKISTNTTLFDLLMQYADDKEAFAAACNNSPLLTIFVPTLPNLSPEQWNADTQIPQIVVEPNSEINSGKISIFDAAGKEERISPDLIPGYPVLVIKTNERVILGSSKESSTIPFFSNDKFSFKFLDNAFDGLSPNSDLNTRSGVNRPDRNIFSIDTVNIKAFQSGSEWHRDYIYYGITPTNPTGKFTNRYKEYIASFKVMNAEDLIILSDHSSDPKAINTRENSTDPMWTEGRFEFRMVVYMNTQTQNNDGLKKYFTAGGNDIFNITYTPIQFANIIFGYKIKSITAKSYKPTTTDIDAWDLQKYGSTWKFVVAEYDLSERHTRTVTHTTTYSGNFEVSLGEIWKVGPKFGGSATTEHSSSYVYETTTGSEDLAEGLLDFRTPVVTSLTYRSDWTGDSQRYNTYEVSTGMVSFSIEPRAIY